MQAMLARQPHTFALPETWFFIALLGDEALRWGDRGVHATRHWYHHAGLAQSWGRRRLLQLERMYGESGARRWAPHTWRGCARHYARMLDLAAANASCSSWIEKSPAHLLYLHEIAASVPGARFVHVLRNGLDVVASIIDADLHQKTRGFRGGAALWAHRWNHAMQLHMACAGRTNHHLLCLEDLVADPAREWARLCDFLHWKPGVCDGGAPQFAVADARTEPWKAAALTGIPQRRASRAPLVFGTTTLEWLRQELVDYRAVRTALHAQRSAVRPMCAHAETQTCA